ncbi:MAG: DEAD/DEAH box helicase [Romboutsia sp.]
MDFNKIKTLIKINTNSARWNRGVIYYNRRLVDHVSFNIDGNTLTLQGMVESEYNNEVYQNSIVIDGHNFKILGGSCSCEDFRSKNSKDLLFICKHLVATSIYGLRVAQRDEKSESYTNNQNIVPILNLSPSQQLLHYFDSSSKEKVNLEVNIEINSQNVVADFKIGTDRMYVLKNLRSFANSRFTSSPLEYGKNFIYNPNIHYFDDIDESIVNMIEYYGNNISQYSNTSYNPKLLDLGPSGLKRFLEILINKEFTLNYYGNKYSPLVIKGNLPIEFDISKCNDKIILTSKDDLPTPLTSKSDVVLYDNNVYLLSNDNSIHYKKIYSILNEFKEISFDKQDIKGILGSLVPKIQDFSNSIILDKEIENNIVSDFNTEFYFDLKASNIICELKFNYNDDNNGEKYILPDTKKEKIFKNKLISYNFLMEGSYYIFRGDDDELFNFLNTELNNLKELGDIYYSDKFKSKKIYNSSSIKASVAEGFDGYLEFSFNISDINEKEYENILDAFKEKKNFYKLKDGSFIDLQEVKTKSFFELVDHLNISNEMNTKIQNNKMLFINEMIESNNLDFIHGKEIIKNICDKFKDIKDLDVEIPKDLTATLRDYQVSGLHWFNVLNHYNFGGILADEMGLGKTLQTISFLCSKPNKKSLIVTPTSLIYNWKNEFDTFAPSMKVLLIHGNKSDRDRSLESINDFDIVITTYGTLRNDLEEYENITFDYCIIDEAQNIKNPVALTTIAVKSINARAKFALTGTPIENNLLELWSIFDFVMPGYLYNRSKFQDLFIGRDTSIENLKKLIRPFILRRTKKEVMKELPDKIEKKFFVDLNTEQRKLYSAYINDIQNKIENPDLKNDNITILSYLTKLRQLCLDPSVLVENYTDKSAKIEACLDILQESIDGNHKILLFSQFTSVLKNIGTHLRKNHISYSYIDGQTNAKERLDLVNEFNEKDDNKIFLISLKAGGTGLNLTSADVVIHFDPWWNPSVENQASDRAHRYGQKNVVEVIKLIARGTIEEKIIKLQETKKELIDEFINGDLSSGNILKSLSDKEIIDLFK